MVDVLMMPVSGPPQFMKVDPGHQAWSSLVNDVGVDMVFAADGSGVLIVGANGKSNRDSEPNPRATQLAERLVPGFAKRDVVWGTAVFAGLDDGDDWADVPGDVVEITTGLFGRIDRSDAAETI